MLTFQDIANAISDLTDEEKGKLRSLIDAEIAAPSSSADNGVKHRSKLIGFCADEPELVDGIMEAVYERRSRPLRISE
jgi:hypothetical protein